MSKTCLKYVKNMSKIRNLEVDVPDNANKNLNEIQRVEVDIEIIKRWHNDRQVFIQSMFNLSEEVKDTQKQATINVFREKGIPFRTFEVLKKNEETLGDLFNFFMLETILLGKMLKINPYDQPAVELIKKETKKILI